jgi:hypothetical protein
MQQFSKPDSEEPGKEQKPEPTRINGENRAGKESTASGNPKKNGQTGQEPGTTVSSGTNAVTRAQMQKMNPMELTESIKNLGPGDGVWTRVNSILTSDVFQLNTVSLVNGFQDVSISFQYATPDKSGKWSVIERLRWYERS